jgi:hypothetical protein
MVPDGTKPQQLRSGLPHVDRTLPQRKAVTSSRRNPSHLARALQLIK